MSSAKWCPFCLGLNVLVTNITVEHLMSQAINKYSMTIFYTEYMYFDPTYES